MQLSDDVEYEAKFYPVDKEEYRKKLLSLGAKLVIPERLLKRITADHRANPSIPSHAYLRIRDEGNLIRLSYKTMAGSDGKLTDQKEIDVEVSDFEKTRKIIEKLGFVFNNKQESLREEWEFEGAQITIDTWPVLDTYSEIEAGSEEEVKRIAETLDFDWNKKIITAAPEIIERVYQIPIQEVLKMVSDLTFENNPFANLEKHELQYN